MKKNERGRGDSHTGQQQQHMKIPDRKRDAHPLETVEEGISGHGRMTGEGSLMYSQCDMGTTEGGVSV